VRTAPVAVEVAAEIGQLGGQAARQDRGEGVSRL